MKMPSDLHTHTNVSDGVLTPEELLEAAKKAGLTYLAITDHDTVDGIIQLYESGLYPTRGLHVIPGIEFSAHHASHDIHILGYNIDPYNRALQDKLNDVVEARWLRFSKMVEKLQETGFSITEADVLKLAGTSTSISRSHIAQTLVAKGFFSDVPSVFGEVLDKGKPAYVPHYRLEPEEIVSLICEAGGMAVLAHPKLVHDDALVESLLQEEGISGIEAVYPQHDEEETKRYMDMAKKYNLLVSGGSDFHGYPQRYPPQLGMFTLPDEYAEKFFRGDSE